jgi:hypothetical protein
MKTAFQQALDYDKEITMDDNTNQIFASLKAIHEKYNVPDPLEQQGIPKDWVCVINHKTYYELKRVIDLQPPSPYGNYGDPVERSIGRELMIIGMADDGANFMPKLEVYRQYAAHFLYQIEIAKERKSREAEESDSDEAE